MSNVRKNALNQSLDIGGSLNQSSSMNLADEALGLGQPLSGQSGSAASITAGINVVITGLSGMTTASVGNFITISGAASGGNNGTFLIIAYNSSSSVDIENTSGSTDANNGSISWIERQPYSLLDDLNYVRTDRANIKEAIGIISGETDLGANLTNQTAFYPFDNLPVTPSVVDALNTLNEQIGDRTYTGAILTDGLTITESLQELSDNASGISPTTHAALRQLIHLSDDDGPFEEFTSGAYREITGGVFPTSTIWWESSAKLEKIVEKTITRNANKTPAVIEWKVYDTDGVTVLATATDTISYSGITETSRTRVIS
jgi:hypothetical protein